MTNTVPAAAAVQTAEDAQQPLPAETAGTDTAMVAGTQQPTGEQQTGATAQQTAQQSGQVPLGDASQLAALTMQPNGVKAGTTSIFAVQQPAGEAQSASVVGTDGETYASPSHVPLPAFNTAKRSLYQATQVPEAAADLPSTAQQDQQVAAADTAGAQQTDLQPLPADEQVATDATQRQEMTVLPVTGAQQTANGGAAATGQQAAQDGTVVATAATDTVPAVAQKEARPKKFTLASFFGAKKKPEKTFNTTRFGAAAETKTISVENPAVVQTASLAGNGLPGVAVNSMFATSDEPAFAAGGYDEDGPEKPIEIAALPGLARLAPNGLWMQTESVETGCFKPELLKVLKGIEAHYGRKLMVTSGFRGERSNLVKGGARHSLHTICAAADIQIAGVGKWELASYLRSLPNRGGVGTYCHTESVHVDIGDPRDWNWRCRRRK